MAVCAVLALILGVGSARFSALAGQGLGANIRQAEYEKLQSYSFANIDHFRVSSVVTRLTSDVTNIQNAVSTGMRPFGRSPVMLIFASSVAFTINRTLALVFFVALPVYLPFFHNYYYECPSTLWTYAECDRFSQQKYSGKSYCDKSS